MKNKDTEFYKRFYEENKVTVMQHESLRMNFNKLVSEALGSDYYNTGMDVYEADRICCEDILNKLNKGVLKGFISKTHCYLHKLFSGLNIFRGTNEG